MSPSTTAKTITFLVIVLGLGACSPGEDNTIAMTSGQRYEPRALTVGSGESVTFVNESKDAHTVTAYERELPEAASFFSSGGFESEDEARDDIAGGLMSADEEFEVRFSVPGTYQYFCIPHEGSSMRGRILVEE